MPSSLFPQQIINKPTGMTNPSPQLMNTMGMTQVQPVQNQNNREQILQLWNQIKASPNPQQIFEQALMNNPELKKTVDLINSMGNPQTLFYTMAKQQGKDPNSVLSLLR